MGLVLNTNIGAIQAQRAITESRQEMEMAMERLSTGSRINSAADDAAGLAMAERMTTQIRGLTMATKNANDGIALVRTVENALVEVSGMLQRMRELSVQAANATLTSTERAFANNELNSLQLEISRVSANTRYNGTQVLNGTFSAKALQVGTMSGEEINLTIDSIESALLGAYVMTGEGNAGAYAAATATTTGYTSTTNFTDDADDITIVGNGNSRTIDISANESAKDVAKKINSVAGATNVFSMARTYAHLFSGSATSTAYLISINGTSTAAFNISSSDVSDAVAKINAIATTTGVMASATTDNKVLLTDSDGDDMIITNGSAGTDLDVQGVKSDGVTVAGSAVSLAANGGSNNDTTKVSGTQRLTSSSGFTVTQTNGTKAAAVDTFAYAALDTAIEAITAGAKTIEFAFAGTTLSFAIEDSGNTAGSISKTADVDTVVADIKNHGSYASANFTVASDGTDLVFTANSVGENATRATYTVTGASAVSATQTTAGVADTWFDDGTTTASLESIAVVDISTQIGASYSIATIDGALETVSGIRGSLGTLQNRLAYSVSNLMKVTEYTIGARSRIQDADFAAETARLAKAQVLQQAGASMLSQANASTDVVLQVLRG